MAIPMQLLLSGQPFTFGGFLQAHVKALLKGYDLTFDQIDHISARDEDVREKNYHISQVVTGLNQEVKRHVSELYQATSQMQTIRANSKAPKAAQFTTCAASIC